jgi:hypothetical protein
MQFTADGVKFIIYIEGKRFIADAVDIQATFHFAIPDGVTYRLEASCMTPDIKLMFLNDYTKLILRSDVETDAIVFKHPAVIELEKNGASFDIKQSEHVSSLISKQTDLIKNYIAKLHGNK